MGLIYIAKAVKNLKKDFICERKHTAMMNEPSIEKLTANGLNRYQICIATAKVAREIINEYNEEERAITGDEKSASKKIVHDDKPVKTAVHAIDAGDYEINPEHNDEVIEEAFGEDAPLNE